MYSRRKCIDSCIYGSYKCNMERLIHGKLSKIWRLEKNGGNLLIKSLKRWRRKKHGKLSRKRIFLRIGGLLKVSGFLRWKYSQIPGIDFSETFSPVIHDVSFWIMLMAKLIWNLKACLLMCWSFSYMGNYKKRSTWIFQKLWVLILIFSSNQDNLCSCAKCERVREEINRCTQVEQI